MRFQNAVRDIVDSNDFQTALWWGLAALAVAIALGILSRWLRGGRPAPVAGLAVTGACAIALRTTQELPNDVRLGLIVLVGAGIIADVVGRPVLIGAPLAVPGALLIGRTVPGTPSWSETLVVVSVVAGGACVASFDFRHSERGLTPPLFALSAIGVYFTVPDTGHALVLLGAALPLALSSWPIPLTRFGSIGAYAAVGVLAWTAAIDGLARPASIVGGIASLGVLVAEPVARLVGRPWAHPGSTLSLIDRLPNTWYTALVIGAVQLGVVFCTSRVAGLHNDVAPAVTISAVALVVTAAVCAITRPSRVPTAST